jgi:hypothetical protein
MLTMRTFLLLLLLCLPCFAQYKTVYDQELKLTRTSFPAVKQGEMWVSGMVSVHDDGIKYGALYFRPSERTLFTRETLHLTLDGVLLSLPNDDVEYSFIALLTPAMLKQIGDSKVVTFRLMSFEGVLDKDILKKVKDLSTK